MKQAKADAQELVDSYRAEKQNLFNNQVLASGKFKFQAVSYTDSFSWNVINDLLIWPIIVQ